MFCNLRVTVLLEHPYQNFCKVFCIQTLKVCGKYGGLFKGGKFSLKTGKTYAKVYWFPLRWTN